MHDQVLKLGNVFLMKIPVQLLSDGEEHDGNIIKNDVSMMYRIPLCEYISNPIVCYI